MDLLARYHALCTPAQVYVVLHIVGMALKMVSGDVLGGLVGGGIMIVVGAWFLNFLCRHDLRWLSWIIAIWLPVLILLVVALGIWSGYKDSGKKKRNGKKT